MVRIQDKRKANLSGKVLNIYSDVTQNTSARDILNAYRQWRTYDNYIRL